MKKRMLEITAYGAAVLGQSGTTLLLLPLYTRLLGPSEFGRWSLLEPLLYYAAQFALLGANYGLIKLIGKDKLDSRQALLGLIPSMSVVILLAAAGAGAVATWWSSTLVVGAGVASCVAAESVFQIALAALRAANTIWKYALSIYAKSAILLAGTVFVLLNGGQSLRSVTAVIWLYALASLSGGVVALIGLARNLSGTDILTPVSGSGRSASLYRAAVAYGAPILGSSLLASVLTVGDRYFLSLNLTDSEVASYVVQVKVANTINLIATPISAWFLVARFQHLNDRDRGERFFSLAALLSLGLYVGIASFLWLIMPQVLPWFTPDFEFQPIVSGLLFIAAVATPMAILLNVGLFNEGRTHWLVVIATASAIFQVVSLLIFIPIFGIAGAAGATALSQVVNVAFLHWGSQKAHPLQWPYARLTALLAGGIALTLTTAAIHTTLDWGSLLLHFALFAILTASFAIIR